MARQALTAHIRAHARRGHEWGVFDCLLFTNGGWRAMFGHGWADDWIGRYMQGGDVRPRAELRREFGFDTLPDAIDARLRPVAGIPPLGALVAKRIWRGPFGYALGLANGHRAVFTGPDRLIHLNIEDVTRAWVET